MSKGKEKLKESLSALMDNEASEFEFRRILKECESNEGLKHKWERFHMLSAAIRGELDNSINAGFSLMQEESDSSKTSAAGKRPDLLSRINAELDGAGSSISSESAINKGDGKYSASKNQIMAVKRIGQGAIAASVAAIVLTVGGSFNTMLPQEAELQLAGQSESIEGLEGIEGIEDNVPEFDNSFSPSEFSLVPRLNAEFDGTEALDEAAQVRLRQAVFQEFIGEPQESVELPVNFNVIIEEE